MHMPKCKMVWKVDTESSERRSKRAIWPLQPWMDCPSLRNRDVGELAREAVDGPVPLATARALVSGNANEQCVHATFSARRSALLTRTSPEISFGSSASRNAAIVRDCT